MASEVGDFMALCRTGRRPLRTIPGKAPQANPKERPPTRSVIADAWLAQGKGEQAAGTVSESSRSAQRRRGQGGECFLTAEDGNPKKVRSAVKRCFEIG